MVSDADGGGTDAGVRRRAGAVPVGGGAPARQPSLVRARAGRRFGGVGWAEPAELRDAERAARTARAGAVAQALFGAGYFGPFGIDGYRYSQDQAGGFCALGEINARYTLGFVTGFPRQPSELLL